jgi:hypothetical protein
MEDEGAPLLAPPVVADMAPRARAVNSGVVAQGRFGPTTLIVTTIVLLVSIALAVDFFAFFYAGALLRSSTDD